MQTKTELNSSKEKDSTSYFILACILAFFITACIAAMITVAVILPKTTLILGSFVAATTAAAAVSTPILPIIIGVALGLCALTLLGFMVYRCLRNTNTQDTYPIIDPLETYTPTYSDYYFHNTGVCNLPLNYSNTGPTVHNYPRDTFNTGPTVHDYPRDTFNTGPTVHDQPHGFFNTAPTVNDHSRGYSNTGPTIH